MNYDKLPRENKSNNNASNYIGQNLHKLSSCCCCFLFENNFPEFGTCNTVFEERINLHIFTESRQEYSLKGTHL